jgi:hypothetical protein
MPMRLADSRSLLGAISAMIVWAVWFALAYGLVGLGCEDGWPQHRLLGTDLLSAAIAASTLVALVLMGWSGWRGWRGWRVGDAGTDGGHEQAQRRRFLGRMMLVLAAIAIVGTLMIGLPLLLLDPCAR